MSAKKEVVIVDAGFGGLAAAEALSGAPVDVTLIDRANHHLFQPLLYQVATPSRRTPRCCIRSECGPRTEDQRLSANAAHSHRRGSLFLCGLLGVRLPTDELERPQQRSRRVSKARIRPYFNIARGDFLFRSLRAGSPRNVADFSFRAPVCDCVRPEWR
nr:FAD-dependent oxidoreductase [Rhizobium binae]